MELQTIYCECNICAENADYLGKEILGARVPAQWGKITKKMRHGYVSAVNHPVLGAGIPLCEAV